MLQHIRHYSPVFLAILLHGTFVDAARDGLCPVLGPVLPAPVGPSSSSAVQEAVAGLQTYLEQLTAGINGSAVSVAVKSLHEEQPLFEFHHTPPVLDSKGVQQVDGDSVYRLASISKVFPVLALLKLDGVSLDDSVTKHLPELRQLNEQPDVKDEVTLVDWDDITLGSLASHLSGIGSDYPIDLANFPAVGFEEHGWPARDSEFVPNCSGFPGQRECTSEDFFAHFGEKPPIHAPFTTAAYGNIGSSILGWVVEKVSGKPYAQFVQEAILDPLGMDHTFASKPQDSLGAIPKGDLFWGASLGFLQAAGGFYSSTNDMLTFADAILAGKILTPAQTRKWLKPWTSTASAGTLIGAPWEIFRSTNVTADQRLVEVYTKSGDLFTYHTTMAMVPDYDLVLTVLVGGPEVSNAAVQLVQAEVVRRLLPALEIAGKEEARLAFVGTYRDEETNSTLILSLPEDDFGPGLAGTTLVVRDADVIATKSTITLIAGQPVPPPRPTRLRLYPTTLRSGSRFGWRGSFDVGTPAEIEARDALLPWEGSACMSWATQDRQSYQLQPTDQFVFNTETVDGRVVARSVMLPSYEVTLSRL